MLHNRRQFITATAAASLLGAPQAHAAASNPWIGFIHGTALDPDLELNFYDGMRGQGFEADPTLPGTNHVNVFSVRINGRYKKGNLQNIELAVKDIVDSIPSGSLKMIVAAGGLIIGQAAATYLKQINSNIPLAVLAGRTDQTVRNYQFAEGYYFDDVQTTNASMQAKLADLAGAYGIANNKICLLYNGNSAMSTNELQEFISMINAPSPLSVDAVSTSASGDNKRINLRDAFTKIMALTAQAVVVSSDPYFTLRMPRIIRLAGNRRFQSLILCYPLLDYGDEATDAGMTTANFMARGPRLSDAYQSLGALVGKRLGDTSGALPYKFSQAAQSYMGLT